MQGLPALSNRRFRRPRTLGVLLLSAGLIATMIAVRGIMTLSAPEPDVGQHVVRHMRYTYAELSSLDTLLQSLQLAARSPAAHTMLADAADHLFVRLQMLSDLTQGPFVDDDSPLKRLSARLMSGLDDLVRQGSPINVDALADLQKISAQMLRLAGDYTRALETRVDAMLDERARLTSGAWIEVLASTSLLLVLSALSLTLSYRNRRMVDQLRVANGRDSLTGLANRRGFADWTKPVEARASRRRHALIVFDLDHFKSVNDRFGHATGDAILQATADRLVRDFGENGIIARWGGDEFVAAVPLVGRDIGQVEAILAELAANPPRVATSADNTLQIDMSCGVALWPDDADTIDQTLICADIALYEAKSAHRGHHMVYRAEMSDRQRRAEDLRAGLDHALARGEIRVVYEPRIRLNRRTLAGVQARLCWHTPSSGLDLSPDAFSRIARESGHMRALDGFLLETACEAAARWRAAMVEPIHMAVALSAWTLQDEGLPAEIERLLARLDLPADALEIELAEATSPTQGEQITVNLARLAEKGVRIAFSTTGPGHPSIPLLARLRPQVLKIDRAQLCLPDTDGSATTVSAMADLAGLLDAKLLIDGVMSAADLDLARDSRCALAQGPFFGPPLPADGIAALARSLRLQAGAAGAPDTATGG